ncbi:MAG: hypothetical protein K0S53_669 [Bacteroidetes bacterium]|jgi:hypothetical protein|nr:hypothetical protein [Bacteroidota bacterium]
MNQQVQYQIHKLILKSLVEEDQAEPSIFENENDFRKQLGIGQDNALYFHQQLCLLLSRKYIHMNCLESGKLCYTITGRGIESHGTSLWLEKMEKSITYFNWDNESSNTTFIPRHTINSFAINDKKKLTITLTTGKCMLILNGDNLFQSKTIIEAPELNHSEDVEGFKTFHFVSRKPLFISYILE